MILIADSGATKAQWAVIEDEKPLHVYETPGFNPYFADAEFIENVVEKDLVPFVFKDNITEIFLYGAGCSTVAKCSVVEEALKKVFPGAHVEVSHDLLGAARSLFGREEGIVAILGTGSNSCLYDGREIIENVPSLGYLFGDEGSGAHMGKQFLNDYLRGHLPEELKKKFEGTFTFDLESILDSVYNRPRPNRFLAAFAGFLGDNKEVPYAGELIRNSFRSFFQEQISEYSRYQEVPMGVVGSIGFHFQDMLREIASEYAVKLEKIAKSPIEGLADFHRKNLI